MEWTMILDIPDVLDALGLDYTERGVEANALCPGHLARTGKSDNSPSWWVNLETGQHICFSCGYKGNILQLVCDVNEFYIKSWGNQFGYDYGAAETWIATVSEMPIERLAEMVRKLPEYVGPAPKPLEMSESRLAVFVTPPEEVLQSRNITEDSASKYGILWDTKTSTWILPLREPHFNRLMGWQEKGTVHRTFFNRPAGLVRSKTLFGIENQTEDVVVVVESPLDCARVYSATNIAAVATCGSSLSEDQIKLIRYSKKVIAAFDNPNLDNAGKKASKEMLEWSRKYGLNLFFFNYGSSSKKDPGDMTNEEILWGIDNAVSALYGELAYVQRDSKALPS
jgi:hypothetical protein